MKYYSRRFVKPNDLNVSDTLFGGQLLSWIDEEAAIYASCQMQHDKVVTKYMSEIDFAQSAQVGDILEFGMEVVDSGRTSLTVGCEVRKKKTRDYVITIDRIVFVAIGDKGKPVPHRYVAKEYQKPKLVS
jgi:acyl-CoA hydrolase